MTPSIMTLCLMKLKKIVKTLRQIFKIYIVIMPSGVLPRVFKWCVIILSDNILGVLLLNVTMLSVIKLSVVILSAVMQSVIILSVVMLSAVTLSVVIPHRYIMLSTQKSWQGINTIPHWLVVIFKTLLFVSNSQTGPIS
jgi:hypothetical protein